MKTAIDVQGLTKLYETGKNRSPLRAVDEIDFHVYPGEVFGLLGPNGAGKTSTIRMLTGLTRPSSGYARILGFDLARQVTLIKKNIGVVPETSNLYDELTALDNLIFSMQLYGTPRAERSSHAEALLERFRLSEKRDTTFARLSRGMKRALTIAAALAHSPRLVFLDEPTTGLDVMSARRLRQMIARLREEGITVFLTTHYLEEAERLCDRIAILVEGRIVALDTVEGLKSCAQKKTVVEVTLANGRENLVTRQISGDDIRKAVSELLDETRDCRLVAIQTLRPSLEDVFVELTGLNAEVMLVEKVGQGGGNAGG